MIQAATLFSGIGAPETAMPSWRWTWHAEIEAFPSAVMTKRHPESINMGDVNAEDFVERAERIGRPDVLVFGSPCQSFSVAGKRLGMDDPRGNLAIIALGIARRLRPRWLVFENVPGLFSSYSGGDEAERSVREGPVGGRADCDEDSDFASFLTAVRECGYLGCHRVFDAQHSGVPQRRRRIFFVGHLGDWRPPFAVLFEPESLRGDRPPSREAGERVAPTVEARANAGGAGWGTDFMAGGGLVESGLITPPLNAGIGRRRGGGAHGDPLAFGGNNTAGSIDIATAVNAHGGPHGRQDFESETFVLAFDETQITQPPTIASDCKAGGNTGFSIGDQVGALRGEGHGGGHAAIAFQTRVARNGRGGAADVVPALNGSEAGATSDMRPCVAAGSSVRRLTPRECERLQAYPDDYTLVTFRGKPAADGPRYRALGNSMNVKDIGAILRRIDEFEKARRESC